jgi:NAD-reducing hydrogenase small subunit
VSVPKLIEKVRPVHEVVPVDVYLPGCPPSADTFYAVLTDLLAGRTPDIASLTRFGA